MDSRYRIEIEFVEDVWVARCPQLVGCVGRGYSVEEAIDALRFSQDDCLARFADAQRWGESCG